MSTQGVFLARSMSRSFTYACGTDRSTKHPQSDTWRTITKRRRITAPVTRRGAAGGSRTPSGGRVLTASKEISHRRKLNTTIKTQATACSSYVILHFFSPVLVIRGVNLTQLHVIVRENTLKLKTGRTLHWVTTSFFPRTSPQHLELTWMKHYWCKNSEYL